MNLSRIVEAIIFVSDQPVSIDFLKDILLREQSDLMDVTVTSPDTGEEVQIDLAGLDEALTTALIQLTEKYTSELYPFEVRALAGGYQFFTKRPFHKFVKQAVLEKNHKRLSKAALETLSIVAYRQPITKAEIEFIRGVSSDYAMQKLLEKKLVSIVGRAEAPGRPLLYATSPFFMQYFGIKDITDLPKLKEFEEMAEDHLDMFRQHQMEQVAKSTENNTTDVEGTERA
ncbi:MAG: SMC-Scp complex subunit ScpB [Bacteroidia bacterium]|nr:SMC-Scp complex subunit ScpB [Bacteroidia bacterium]